MLWELHIVDLVEECLELLLKGCNTVGKSLEVFRLVLLELSSESLDLESKSVKALIDLLVEHCALLVCIFLLINERLFDFSAVGFLLQLLRQQVNLHHDCAGVDLSAALACVHVTEGLKHALQSFNVLLCGSHSLVSLLSALLESLDSLVEGFESRLVAEVTKELVMAVKTFQELLSKILEGFNPFDGVLGWVFAGEDAVEVIHVDLGVTVDEYVVGFVLFSCWLNDWSLQFPAAELFELSSQEINLGVVAVESLLIYPGKPCER